jgi:hypothetical protein
MLNILGFTNDLGRMNATILAKEQLFEMNDLVNPFHHFVVTIIHVP